MNRPYSLHPLLAVRLRRQGGDLGEGQNTVLSILPGFSENPGPGFKKN